MRVTLPSLVLKGGSRISLADPGVTVIVGPSSSGKTLLLREIVSYVGGELEIHRSRLKILSSVDVKKEGTVDELLIWLEKQGLAVPNDRRHGYQTSYRRYGVPFVAEGIRAMWEDHEDLAGIRDVLVAYHPHGESASARRLRIRPRSICTGKCTAPAPLPRPRGHGGAVAPGRASHWDEAHARVPSTLRRAETTAELVQCTPSR